MIGNILGVDIGYDSLKMVLCRNGVIRKTAVADMPANLLQDAHITSPQAMGELIRATMRKNRIRAFQAAVVLHNEATYTRNVTMPRMTESQLRTNLPYEFSDYIEGEVKDYCFDYAMISNPKANPEEENMELLAVAAPVYILNELKETMNYANMRLAKAAPVEYVHIPLLRRLEKDKENPGDYCILDMGYRSIRMFMYRGDRFIVGRMLEPGLRSVDEAVADALNVDVHLAHTFFATNYDNCQEKEFCAAAYNNLAVEMMRALNFYRFSNPDSTLTGVWLSGGGAGNVTLRNTISETLGLEVHTACELLPGPDAGEQYDRFLQAVGATLD